MGNGDIAKNGITRDEANQKIAEFQDLKKQEEDRGTGGLPEGTGDKRVILSRRARPSDQGAPSGGLEVG